MNNYYKYYTKKNVAKSCYNTLLKIIGNEKDYFFIEPSAGNGDFYDLLPKNKIGIDISSNRKDFLKKDFLKWDFKTDIDETIVLGNPPFGKRGELAIRFINKASEISNTIAFILPVIFEKYFIQKKVNNDLKLIYSKKNKECSFYTISNKDYKLNTVFQIWTRIDYGIENKRSHTPPATKHDDFIMYQYNNTEKSLKHFNNNFDFAVPCQGWQDYNRKETDKDKCEKNKQWILFKSKNEKVNRKLCSIDFKKLALKNTSVIPGFRKNDIVKEYNNL